MSKTLSRRKKPGRGQLRVVVAMATTFYRSYLNLEWLHSCRNSKTGLKTQSNSTLVYPTIPTKSMHVTPALSVFHGAQAKNGVELMPYMQNYTYVVYNSLLDLPWMLLPSFRAAVYSQNITTKLEPERQIYLLHLFFIMRGPSLTSIQRSPVASISPIS